MGQRRARLPRSLLKDADTFLLTMRGTPYYYFGDELGMTNIRFDRIEDYRDIMTINLHKLIARDGGDLAEFMESQKIIARDNGRTPFQWNNSPNAGFTSGTPWLKVNANYKEINAEAQERNENSPLHYFRKLLRFRKQNLVLIYGSAEFFDLQNDSVMSYTRELEDTRLLILLNFTAHAAATNLGFETSRAECLLSNHQSFDGMLKSYQAVILQLSTNR